MLGGFDSAVVTVDQLVGCARDVADVSHLQASGEPLSGDGAAAAADWFIAAAD